MATSSPSSLLIFGVEWGAAPQARDTIAQDRLAERLLQQLLLRRLSATWAIRDINSSWVRRIRAAAITQEIALDGVSRTPRDERHVFSFAGWLREQVGDAEQRGLALRSLVVDTGRHVPLQVLAKLGFRVLRDGGGLGTHRWPAVRPQLLRHGLWRLPVSAHWPPRNRFLQQVVRHQSAWALRRSIFRRDDVHLVFRMDLMMRAGNGAISSIERLLDAAAALRDQQQLRVVRMMDIDHLARLEHVARPMQSILRRTA